MNEMILIGGAEVLPATSTMQDGSPGDSIVTVTLLLLQGDLSKEPSHSPTMTLTLEGARNFAKELLSKADLAESMKRTGALQ